MIQLKSIKGFGSFNQIYQIGKKFYANSASAVVVFKHDICNESHIIFYGVAVSKKIAKKAVIRNRIKRLLRESLRIIVKEDYSNTFACIDKIILTYHAAPTHQQLINLQEILPVIKNILEQANFYYSNSLKGM